MSLNDLRNQNDKNKSKLEKQIYRLVYSYLYSINKRVSQMAQSQGAVVAQYNLEFINNEEIYKLYYEIFNKTGLFFANDQMDKLEKMKFFGVGFWSKIWQDYISTQLLNPLITAKITKVKEATKRRVRDLLIQAVNTRLSPREIARLFMNDLPFSRSRSLLIARTEMTHAASLGVEFAAQQSKLELYSVWIHSKVGDYRETHLAMNGQYVKKGSLFVVDGASMSYAGDPKGGIKNVANCRCTTQYLTKEILEELGLWKG